MDVAAALRLQGRTCGDHGSPMYADVLERAAADLEAGGPTAEVLAVWEGGDPLAAALPLRLMGSVHRLVLERRAGELAAFYPSVGGAWQPDAGWDAVRRLLAEQRAEVQEWLDRPPQTNEVGRAAGLYGALLQAPRGLPVRLVEIGSSGGLNLRADRFAYRDDAGRAFGHPGSPLRIDGAWRGRALEPWPELSVVQRLGCDPRPVDVATTPGRLALTAYVWADQVGRLERLRRALEVAAQVPAEVRRQGAADLLRSLDLAEGTTTVVWHSVMWQYLDPEEQAFVAARLDDLGARASATRRLAHIAVEPVRRDPEPVFEVRLRTWPDEAGVSAGEARVLGTSVPHGVPTTWR